MSRTLTLFLAALACACAATATAGAAPSTTTTYADPTGDAGTAPDITSTVVTSVARTLQFQVSLAAAPTASSISIYLDTDQYASTGDPATYGAEYRVTEDQVSHTVSLSRWVAGAWQPAPAPSLTVTGIGTNTIVFTIDTGAVGVTTAFNFSVRATVGAGGPGAEDDAPNNATYGFQLNPPKPLKLTVVGFQAEQVGHNLGAALIVRRSDTKRLLGAEAAVSCRASIAGRPLPKLLGRFMTLQEGGVKAPVAMCVWSLGAHAHGKTVNGTMTVSYAGATATKAFSTRVK